ncbi:MBL fold metallo-hydrolase [Oleiagrimonas sp.]|jgi:hypothetical protein|uniref:MBL fold metallo-hydrolase n=1 Tax=Oleiagrimonas sp. TaxID=2010330 RepID=UPI00261066D2|nr:MBL fold metallo-hydrolase [Oleiagrimonas sp.]MDA3913196.1 MBL fold metallo-hydrolase [Oleiagrimonas sp.]
MNFSLRFLGTGAAEISTLGHSSAVIERDGEPLLLIDCGPDAVPRYMKIYQQIPRAIYITHVHLDHVGGLEPLFSRLWFGETRLPPPHLFAHASLIPLLQGRIADYPGVAAEGGSNFWDAFRLTPCSRGFWYQGLWFDVFATRHHRPGTSYGVALRGSFTYTGDTRPIAETLAVVAEAGGPIAHDCSVTGNPSHTGLDDLEREYPANVRERLLLYHYGSVADGDSMRASGYRVAHPGECVPLPPPRPLDSATG